MKRVRILTLAAGLALAGVSAAEPAGPQFRWKVGEVLTYRVQQTTTVTETLRDAEANTEGKTQSVTRLGLVKRWEVKEVDPGGVATLQLVVPALRMETTLPGLDPIVFDSGNPDRSDPTLRAEMSKYLGKPVAEVRIDPKGKLVEVKESRFGPANRFEADLPFKLTLPETAPAAGQGWSRTYRVKLDPPQGAGESYEAAQHYSLKGESDGLMVVAMRTELKSLPPAVIEQIPLLPLLPEGEVYFNPKTGRYHGAKLRVEKELVNHQGEGSRYLYQSSYVEGLVVEEK